MGKYVLNRHTKLGAHWKGLNAKTRTASRRISPQNSPTRFPEDPVFLIWLFVSAAWAQSPEMKKTVPPITDETKGANKPKNNSQGQKTVTVEFPSTLNVTVDGKLEVKTENENTKRNDEGTHLAEWFIALFTGLLVVVTG